MNSTAKPSRRCSARICSRISRSTITSSAVVGSSRITSDGLERQRDARCPRAAACRPRAGGRRRRAASAGMPTISSSSPRARARPPGRDRRGGRGSVSHDLLADRDHRVQRVHRALEHHRDALPAQLAQLGLAERQQVACPRTAPRRRRSPPAAAGCAAAPAPASTCRCPTRRRRRGSRRARRRATRGRRRAPGPRVGDVVDAQVADGEQRLSHGPSPPASSASGSLARAARGARATRARAAAAGS